MFQGLKINNKFLGLKIHKSQTRRLKNLHLPDLSKISRNSKDSFYPMKY